MCLHEAAGNVTCLFPNCYMTLSARGVTVGPALSTTYIGLPFTSGSFLAGFTIGGKLRYIASAVSQAQPEYW
jgi:hypothetical protein